jgi:hypothetical protein
LNSNYGIEFIILSNLVKFLRIYEIQTRFELEFELIQIENKKGYCSIGLPLQELGPAGKEVAQPT